LGEYDRKCQRAFRPMVNILNFVNWVVALNMA